MIDALGITPSDIDAARRRIAGRVVRTPLLPSRPLTERAGAEVRLKPECLQPTGSFKLRGATNKILSLSDEERRRGLITMSSGNHGRAVACVASGLGIRAIVCLYETVPSIKVEGIRQYGAEVLIAGATFDDADLRAAEMEREQGLSFIHPFDDPPVIAGQGTIGLEILEDLPDVDTVLVPVSGGGLISGIALAVKSANPGIRVVGAMMDRAPVMAASLKAGRVVELQEEPTLADALAGNLGRENHFSFRICRALVDTIVLVSEEEIAGAMSFMLWRHGLVVEGGGAVGIAALLARRVELGRRAAVVISGGNVDISRLLEIARRHGADGVRP
jgi:threonine dehydratase